jgi:chromosome partitioning protein
MNNCKIITVANQKGGTAKSTTVANLAYALANRGYKTLCIDMDPQGNLSMSLGIDAPDKLQDTVHEALTAAMRDDAPPDLSEYIRSNGNLDVLPSNINLFVTEINLRDEMGGEHVLTSLLDPLRSQYEYILIDTNPYLGLLTINALAACDSVLIPVSPQLWSATGLTDLLVTIRKIRRKINPRIEIAGIVLTMCDERTNLYREVKRMLCEHFGDKLPIFETEIPSTVRVGEANFQSVSVARLDPRNKAARAYEALAEEVVQYETVG